MRKYLIGIVAGVVLLASGVALASIPGPDGVIHACRSNGNGELRAVDETATCPNGWTALSWNQSGPAGSSGMSGYEVIASFSGDLDSDPGTTPEVRALCPIGKQPVGGGFSLFSSQESGTVAASLPAGRSWSVTFRKGIGTLRFSVTAICVNVAS